MNQAQDFIRKIEHEGVTYTFGMHSAPCWSGWASTVSSR